MPPEPDPDTKMALALLGDPPVTTVTPQTAADDDSWRSIAIERLSLILPTVNYYEDDEQFLNELTRKPANVVIFGKPGVGKTTLAKNLAKKMHLVRIDPEALIEYYMHNDVFHHFKLEEVLSSGGSITDRIIAQLLEARVIELDTLHRGYIIDGFPILESEEFTLEEQLDVLQHLPLPPKYIINLQISDDDLYKKRTEQKIDPQTFIMYTRAHYMKRNAALGAYYQSQYKMVITPEQAEADKDFPPLTPQVIFRLISRPEDTPFAVWDELELYSSKWPTFQTFIDKFEPLKVLELDGTQTPSALLRTALAYFETSGERPASIPELIYSKLQPYLSLFDSPEGEFLGEGEEDDDDESELSGACSDDEPEIPWESVLRACKMYAQDEESFKWRISRWHNLCPVALKYGRSIAGKPRLVTSFLDNIFFLSSPDALEQFKFNPRPYLLPKMPTSPIKFFVMGHPLAGKSAFAKELAFITKSSVVDMNHEMETRYPTVTHDYLYKKKLKYTLDAKLMVDRDARKAWRKEERARRDAMRKWIADYLRSLEEAEINAFLDADKPQRNAERAEFLKESELHELQFPIHADSGVCQLDESKIAPVRKKVWAHQQILELAVDLFHDHSLRYKSKPKQKRREPRRVYEEIGESGEFGSDISLLYGEDMSEPGEEDDEELGEGDAESSLRIRKKKRKHCKRKPETEETKEIEEKQEEYPDSSDIDPDDLEVEESYRMRFPMIPPELLDIVPKPTSVPDHHPIVEQIVLKRLEEDERYVETIPTELYIEVLRRACAEAESKYHVHNVHGPLTGGWVVDNLKVDIEKWRGILRTPDVCPDQVFVLLDHSENHKQIFKKLKKIFKENALKGNRMKELLDELEQLGESMYDVVNAEDDPDLLTHVFPKTSSQILHDSLPHDDLDLPPVAASDTSLLQILLDAHRERTPDPHDNDELDLLLTEHERLQKLLDAYRAQNPNGPDNEELTLLLEQHEQFILNHVRSNMSLNTLNKDQQTSGPSMVEARFLYPEILVRLNKPVPTAAELIEEIKEGVWIITEYLRIAKDVKGQTELEKLQEFLAMRSNASTTGEDGDDIQSNEISTPLALRSSTQLIPADACPEDLPTEQRIVCINDYKDKHPSPKRMFFSQIRQFDEFWNMAVPVCNEQRVRFWEVGVVKDKNARINALTYWDKLEARFAFRARKIPDNALMGEGGEDE